MKRNLHTAPGNRVARHAIRTHQTHQPNRRGAIMAITCVLMVFLLGMVAFAVDLSYLAATKTELQGAADGASLAAGCELVNGLGTSPLMTQTAMQTAAKSAGVAVAAKNGNAELSATALSSGDFRFGRTSWNATTKKWDKTWGATPATAVEVVAQRGGGQGSTGGGNSLKLFFGGVLGKSTANLSTNAVAAVMPGAGFKVPPGSTLTIGALPIACDLASWDAFIAGSGSDNYSYNATNGAVSSGADMVKELNIYPDPNSNLPAGNRGTVDLGNPNNSTADLVRQITYGLNATDLSFFPNNTISTESAPLIVNGDTGISAGIKASLEAIKGKPRLMPIYTMVGTQAQATSGVGTGQKATGNNLYYRVVKFVGVRIVFVQLTGNNKQVPTLFGTRAARDKDRSGCG